MRKLVRVLIALAAAVVARPAAAADLDVRKGPVPPPPVLFSWSGFYIGIHGGGVWFDKDWFAPDTPANLVLCAACPTTAGRHTASSWLAGAQAGFNYQVVGSIVVGAEAQFSWTNLDGSAFSLLVPTTTNHSKTDFVGTIAGRLGIAFDRALLFVKGGGAWAHDEFWTTDPACGASNCQSAKVTRWGYMLGIGLEYAFWDNWSAKIEYDYLDFSRQRETLTAVCAGCAAFDYDIDQQISLVKVGLNYRFGGPVVARY